jgi:hypothetical protein
MDRFTRNYSIALGLLALVALGSWLSTLSFRAGELNELLEHEPLLADYPYPFRVVDVKGTTAVMTSPRSPEVPAVRFLAVIWPELAGRDTNDPAVIAAQKGLAEHQGLAKKRVLAEPDIERVRWQVDRQWYAEHGIPLQ